MQLSGQKPHLFLSCYQNAFPDFALLLGFLLLWSAQMNIAKSYLSLLVLGFGCLFVFFHKVLNASFILRPMGIKSKLSALTPKGLCVSYTFPLISYGIWTVSGILLIEACIYVNKYR